MSSSAFEIIVMPVLWGTVYGIVMGMAMLALMRALHLPRGTDTVGSNLEQGREITPNPPPTKAASPYQATTSSSRVSMW
jgi:hypothetical protein